MKPVMHFVNKKWQDHRATTSKSVLGTKTERERCRKEAFWAKVKYVPKKVSDRKREQLKTNKFVQK